MKKSRSLSNKYFLNRLAMEHQCNPAQLRLHRVLREICQFAQPEDFMEMLDAFFNAAVDEETTWKEGRKPSAGNSMFVIEQVEMIIEAAYLLHERWKLQPGKYQNKTKEAGELIPAGLPLLLSETEIRNPAFVIIAFFDYLSLAEWKKLLHEFLVHALSYGSVTACIDHKYLFAFSHHLRKLVWAAWILSRKRKP
jgi:hypothetical protein